MGYHFSSKHRIDMGHFSFMLQTEIQATLICDKSIGNMEVQSRRDTSAQRPLGLIMLLFASILHHLFLLSQCLGKSFGPNMGFHCKNHKWNGMKWNEMMCFGSCDLITTVFLSSSWKVLLFSLECTRRKNS